MLHFNLDVLSEEALRTLQGAIKEQIARYKEDLLSVNAEIVRRQQPSLFE